MRNLFSDFHGNDLEFQVLANKYRYGFILDTSFLGK